MKLNPQIKDADKIFVDQNINLPPSPSENNHEPSPMTPPPSQQEYKSDDKIEKFIIQK